MRFRRLPSSHIPALPLALASLLSGARLAHADPDDSNDAFAAPAQTASEQDPAGDRSVLRADRMVGTGQWFWLQGKAMPGIELGVGRGLFEADLELSIIRLTQRSSDLEGNWVGNQLGAFLMLTPLRGRHYDVDVGLGGDLYWLWGIHSAANEAALAARVVARVWPLENLGLTFTARTYLLHSVGLDLGTARDGSSGPSVLLSTGLTWRFF